MAGERLSIEAQFNALEFRGRRVAFNELRKVNRFTQMTVEVPAGESRLALLEDRAVTDIAHPQFLWIASDEEGVEWWPIDEAAPDVDPETADFGWILDNDAADFEHTHGKPSGLLITGGEADHALIGQKVFHNGVLPNFLGVVEDRSSVAAENGPLIYHDQVTGTTTPRSSKVLSGGVANDLTITSRLAGGGNGNSRVLIYAWGMDEYQNHGAPGDGLRFFPVIYVADPTTLGTATPRMRLVLSSYPFTVGNEDPLTMPATQLHGEEIWAVDDIMLCPNHGNPTCGYNFLSHPYHDWQVTNAETVPAGYSTLVSPKKSSLSVVPRWARAAAQSPSPHPAGIPTWNRSTLLRFHVTVASNGGVKTSDVRLANVWFGPLPGARRVLRPFWYTTDRPWAVGSKPAIGLKNPTGVTARVRVAYGSA